MNELIQYGEQFGKIIDIIESAKERATAKSSRIDFNVT